MGIVALALRNRNEKKKEAEFKVRKTLKTNLQELFSIARSVISYLDTSFVPCHVHSACALEGKEYKNKVMLNVRVRVDISIETNFTGTLFN